MVQMGRCSWNEGYPSVGPGTLSPCESMGNLDDDDDDAG